MFSKISALAQDTYNMSESWKIMSVMCMLGIEKSGFRNQIENNFK